MVDATQWMINLLAPQAGTLIAGLTVLILIIESLIRFRKWVQL